MVENKLLTILTSLTSYSTHKSILWANEWYSIILWFHPRCLPHLWPQITTLWATIATHLRAKMAENGLKQVLDDAHFRNPLFYAQICFLGQQVVFNYPIVLLNVPTMLRTPYNYPIGHHSPSFVNKNSRKQSKTGFWWFLPPKPLILQTNLFYGPTSGVQLSYCIIQGGYYPHDPIELPNGPP